MNKRLYSIFIILGTLGVLPSCGGGSNTSAGSQSEVATGDGSCPAEVEAPAFLPGVSAEHRTPEYWFSLLGAKYDLDEVLLTTSEVDDLNRSYEVERPGFYPQKDLLQPLDEGELREEIQVRFDWMKGKLSAGEYRRDKGPDAFHSPDSPRFGSDFRVALEETQIYCAPTSAGFFDSDTTNDRTNRNHCSNVHAQELLELITPWSGDMILARTATSWGFVKKGAAMSPTIPTADVESYSRGPFGILRSAVKRKSSLGELTLNAHTRLPYVDEEKSSVRVATKSGFTEISLESAEHQATTRELTRRAVIEEVLSYLGTPYGFGGADGGIDCSRLMLDTLGSFDIRLPRFSGWQAKAGTFSFDVENVEDATKLDVIDKAAESGVVILHIPGHIMMYLGRDDKDVPMAVHALSYYLDACEEGGSTTMVVGRVQIGGLELGRDTRKTALLERITKVTVIGKAPNESVRSMALMRPAAPTTQPSKRECKKLPSKSLFVTPERPSSDASVRVIASARESMGPATISFYDSKGTRHDSLTIETGGPPKGYIGQIDKPRSGEWMAVWGDGSTHYGCTTFKVSKNAARGGKTARGSAVSGPEGGDSRPIWSLRRKWSPRYEDLYAIFSERLFDYPAGDDRTWPNLHSVLRDPQRNLLFNHFSKDEEMDIKLKPDCADLPYTLRAYFAWKLGLPFGVHECRRAKEGKPPKCKMVEGNLMARSNFKGKGDVKVFVDFVNRHVRRMVHSSSGRTAPNTDLSDFYPVELKRESLRPGTLFTDPYGHLLVVVDWIDQGSEGYGSLVGADAQPDGTIGRRRFWQGSFLFKPDVDSGGAGFKAFRPWYFDRGSKALATRSNKELRRDKTAVFSNEQYEGSQSDFYDKMESIINPRALDPMAKLKSLVDALEEQVVRRGTSVLTGEDFMATRNFKPIDMPSGSKIFLTSGPWEDFSTPSRDWRLLIAIHTVVDFPDSVRRSPAQYGISEGEVDARAAALQSALDTELGKREFNYARSDGSPWKLTLKDLIDRRVSFEMSYNPNDCPEIRWAAIEGADEMSTCKRHAPKDQRRKMKEYRPWFSKRSRPAR